eukprot:g5362.t1
MHPRPWKEGLEEDLIADVEQEVAEVVAWVRKHPCPPEDKVTKWVENVASGGDDDMLRVLLRLGISGAEIVDHFDYQLFKKLWEAPLADDHDAERQVQYDVGVALDKKAGFLCMQQHFYMINYAMCRITFYPASANRPASLGSYVTGVSQVWNGVGQWLT